jgi:predicted PolB exonuclease-like 3'-5' exonuclease
MFMEMVLDIETLPPPQDSPIVLERFGVLDDETYRELALRPGYARILALGVNIIIDHKLKHEGVYGRDKGTLKFHLDEKKTLRQFWNLIKKYNPSRLLFIGHNLLDFDLRILWAQSIIHQVEPSVPISFARYRSYPVYDIMWEFTAWKQRISLDEMATLLGLKSSKEGLDGSRVYEFFLEGRDTEIADYCLRDVQLAREIYYRMHFGKDRVC